MWKTAIRKLSGKAELAKTHKQPSSHHRKTTTHHPHLGEVITVKFSTEFKCYDTDHEMIGHQNIPAGTYRMNRVILSEDEHHQSIWYLFRGETRGLTERTLRRHIKKGTAQLV